MMQKTSYHSFSPARSAIEKRSKKILDILSGMMFTCAILRDSIYLIAHLHAAALPFDCSAYRASSAPALTAGRKSLCGFALSEAHRLGFAREASADLPSGGTSLREDSKTLRVCLMADFCARDSASPGRHQPTSLREALLFEKTQERSESA